MAFDILDFPEAADAPDWLTHNSAWIFHLPMVPVILKLLEPRVFVELGTFRGDSYMGFCQGVEKLKLETRCTAVDTWRGDAHAGHYGPEVLADLRRHHDVRYGRFSRLLQADFDAASQEFSAGSIDLLHIDGLHTYEAVKHDYETWLPKMSAGGVMLFHDTVIRERGFGVWRLWEEISAGRPHFEVPYGCGLGMLAVGAETPAGFTGFLADLAERHERILPWFVAMGRRNDLMRNCMMLVGNAHDSQAVCNQWRTLTAQAIRQATPAQKQAWDQPGVFAAQCTRDVGQLAADAVGLLQEVTAFRKAKQERETARV